MSATLTPNAPANDTVVMSSGIVLPGTGDMLPTSASLIVVKCQVCRQERPAPEYRDGACLDCRVGRKLAPRYERLIELLRKQYRYERRHQSCDGTKDQVGRELKRMFSDIKDMVPQRKRQLEYVSRAIEMAEKAAVA